MNIKWIFFDIGNVLCNLDFESVWDGFINECKIPIEKIKEALYDEYLFNGFECGKLSPEEYYRGIISKLNCNLGYHRFVQIWNSIIIKNDRMFELAKKLKTYFRILILSNTNILNASVLDRDLKDVSDEIVYSFEVGYMKPDPNIYQIALHKAEVFPANVLFVDDLIENILVAKELGFNTYLFDGISKFEKYIDSLVL